LWRPADRTWIYVDSARAILGTERRNKDSGWTVATPLVIEGEPKDTLPGAVKELSRGRRASLYLGADLVRFSLVSGTSRLSERDWLTLAAATARADEQSGHYVVTLDASWRKGQRLAVAVPDVLREHIASQRRWFRTATPLLCERANAWMAASGGSDGAIVLWEPSRLSALAWRGGALTQVANVPAVATFDRVKAFVDRLRIQMGLPDNVNMPVEIFNVESGFASDDLPEAAGAMWRPLASPMLKTVPFSEQADAI